MRLTVVVVGMVAGSLLACTGATAPSEPDTVGDAVADAGDDADDAPVGREGKAGKRGKHKAGRGDPGEEGGDDAVGAGPGGPAVGTVASSHVQGCGCYLAQGEAGVFQSDLDHTAWMNVDGADVALEHTSGSLAGLDKLGAKADEVYSGGGVTATVHWTVNRVCGAEPGCESVGYDVAIDVTNAAGTTTITAAGACGC